MAKNNSNGAGKLGTAVMSVTALLPVAKIVLNELKNYVKVPDLCSKLYPHSLAQAEKALAAHGLAMASFNLAMKDAAPEYRDCSDMQVVSQSEKAGHMVRIGEIVNVNYITQDVIDESQRLFDEAERRKAKIKERKAPKRAKEQRKPHRKTYDAKKETRKSSYAHDGNCDWICDYCGAYMNTQRGFNVRTGTWRCAECGALNDVSPDNVLDLEGMLAKGISEFVTHPLSEPDGSNK